MNKRLLLLFDLLLLLIISIPTFISIINNQYFTIHDNQHIVRLYLLDQGIRQGYLYPRWVDKLTFGFGDPLFNFYPPLVYYLAEIFHLIGFSLIWSIKLVFISGFILAAVAMYLLIKEYLGRIAAILGATIYTYFFYHAVNAYVRGALAEFFTMSILPLVFLTFYKLTKNINLKNSLIFGLTLALIIITHQLIALSLIFFLFFYFLFYFINSSAKVKLVKYLSIGSAFGLALSAFYWIPMVIEKNFTFLDQELGGYKLHYVDWSQFWYSPWGFGGSVPGLNDGMTFQLGKIPISLFIGSVILFIVYLIRIKKRTEISHFIFFTLLLFFSLFMTTSGSSFIWDKIKLLWNLQFPWRFMVFTGIFMSLICSYSIFFITKILNRNSLLRLVPIVLTAILIMITIIKYQQYFKPQTLISVSDKDLTTYDEIAWEQSKTVLHFVPKGVKTKKTDFGVDVLDIEKKDLPKQIYSVKNNNAKIEILDDKFAKKVFKINAQSDTIFQLNTFYFPGWNGYLDNKKVNILANNKYKLITVLVPKGEHELKFLFMDTPIRKVGDIISIIAVIFSFIIFL